MKNLNDSISPTERTVLRPKLETFDDILPYVGDYGRYQWLLLLALLPFGLTYAFLYFSQFFITITPAEHWCRIDELMNSNFTQADRIKIAIPPSDEYPYYDQCRRKDVNFTELLKAGADLRSLELKRNRTVGCTSWEYNFTEIPYSSVGTELDWVCDQEHFVSTAQSIFFCGSILGGFLIGWIADHKGRIPALIVCNSVALVGSIATANANSFWSFAVCRFLTGLAFDNCIDIPLIIVLEYMSVSKRTVVVNVAFGIYFAVASTILPWMAYYISNWRLFTYVNALPFLSVFITPWILPESARCFIVISFDSHVYSLKLIQSSVFVSFSLSCFTELPAGLLLTLLLDRWGRRLCGFLTLAITCVLSIAELMFHSIPVKLTMSVMSRFCLNMAANIGLQYAAELLPTPVRSQGVSLIHIFGIIAHTLAPYIIVLATVWEGFPMLIIGVVSFAGAALVTFLPETLGQCLPHTISQGEEFGRDQNFWSLPCYKSRNLTGIANLMNDNRPCTRVLMKNANKEDGDQQ